MNYEDQETSSPEELTEQTCSPEELTERLKLLETSSGKLI